MRTARRHCHSSRDKETNTTPFRKFIFWLSQKKSFTTALARCGMKYGFARRFVAGETLEEAIDASAQLCRAGRRVSLNELGEYVSTAAEAENARDHYIGMIHALDRARLDGNVSIKLTHLGLDIDRSLCASLTQEITATARRARRTIEIDMEASTYTQSTIEIFEITQRRYGNAGLAIQAYLRRSEHDLQRLAPIEPKVRLVKGAYRESRDIAFQKRKDVDANYRHLLDRLLRPGTNGRFTTAIATHDPVLVGYAQEKIRQYGLSPERYEFQMIYGIRRDLQQQVYTAGHPLRIYVPFGTAWCPYFLRRLAERPANLWFVLRSIVAERKSPE